MHLAYKQLLFLYCCAVLGDTAFLLQRAGVLLSVIGRSLGF